MPTIKDRKHRFGSRTVVWAPCFILLIVLSIFPLSANSSTDITVSFQLTASIESTITSPNLAPIPGSWGDYNLYGDFYYGSITGPQLTHADYVVTHDSPNPSIRIDGPGGPGAQNWARECNNRWITVVPGDHVIFRCWIKTNPSSIGPGGIIGVDLYGQYGRLWEVHTRNPQSGVFDEPHTGSPIYVPYGSDWTLLSLDFTVPNTLFTRDDYGQTVTPQYVCGMMPWVTASFSLGESASAWFSDAELYINP